MTRLIHAQKPQLPILAHLAVLLAVDNKGRVPRGLEGCSVRVLERDSDGLASEPVADAVCVAGDEGYANVVVEDRPEVLFEIGVDEVNADAEALADFAGGDAGVVNVDAEGVLHLGRV